MSRILPIGFLVFTLPQATDVEFYNLYFRDSAEVNAPLTYQDTFVHIPSEAIELLEDGDDGKGRIDLSNVDWSDVGGVPNEANIIFGISAVDEVGNESDIAGNVVVPFDQDAPDAPTNVEFRSA